MGILSFLKKKDRGMDVPPPPPAPEGMIKSEENISEDIPAPPTNDELSGRDIPEPPMAEEYSGLSMEFPEIPKEQEHHELKPIPKEVKFEPIKKEVKVIHPVSMRNVPERKFHETKAPEVKRELGTASEERHFLDSPIFIKKERYKNVIGGINIIKNKISDCDRIVESLEQIKNSKDKEFAKWSSNLEDMQRKLMVVEKSLFEVGK